MRIQELANTLKVIYKGEDFEPIGINTLVEASKNELSFFDNQKYIDDLRKTDASAVFISEKFVSNLPDGVEAIICDDPYLSMAYASKIFAKKLITDAKEPTISKSAIIGQNVHIGNGSFIGDNVTILAGAFIGENVTISNGSIIYPNVTIYNDVQIGKHVTLHAGSVIGCDGFGYAHTKTGEHIKIYHNGNVILEDYVEVGANSAVDRAVFGSTIIKEGTKIDNLVQIGHNCEIGKQCILVSQSGISGSTKLGTNVVMGGQAATAGHLEIGDFATIAARGGVTKSIEGGKVYSGFPLLLHKDWLRLQAKISKYFK
jgi:UDP-3-O-[3-hydroxymyristoyl] glucosamine N-acyltransferase